MLLELGDWFYERTASGRLALAGGGALNCVANTRFWREGTARAARSDALAEHT